MTGIVAGLAPTTQAQTASSARDKVHSVGRDTACEGMTHAVRVGGLDDCPGAGNRGAGAGSARPAKPFRLHLKLTHFHTRLEKREGGLGATVLIQATRLHTVPAGTGFEIADRQARIVGTVKPCERALRPRQPVAAAHKPVRRQTS